MALRPLAQAFARPRVTSIAAPVPGSHALRTFRIVLSLVLPLIATGVRSASGLNEVLLNGSAAGITQHTPQVASYDGNILVVWADFTSPSVGRLNYGYSTDGGNTFVDQDIPPCASGWRWSSDPVLRVDPVTGVFLLVAHIARLGPGNTPGIGFARGTFSGGTFTWERESAITDLGGVYGFFYVASITVGMRQSTDEYLVLYTTSPNPSKELRLVSSRNGGITWGTPVTLAKNGPHYGLRFRR